MQKYKFFLKYQLPYIAIVFVCLIGLFLYLENLHSIREKKETAIANAINTFSSAAPQLALAVGLNVPTPTPVTAVAGFKTQNTVVAKGEENTDTSIQTSIVAIKTEDKEYEVIKGDYLWAIAEKLYGDGFKAYDIAKDNNISNPDLLLVGQKLRLSPKVKEDVK